MSRRFALRKLTRSRRLRKGKWRWIPRRDISKSVGHVHQAARSGLILVTSAKAIWDFEGIFCSSRHIPGVRFAGLIHPGILGCAPSAEVLATWNKREAELIDACSHMARIVALAPLEQSTHAGTASEEIKAKVAKEGARTIPGRSVCSLPKQESSAMSQVYS